jgi:hypothetical protein
MREDEKMSDIANIYGLAGEDRDEQALGNLSFGETG